MMNRPLFSWLLIFLVVSTFVDDAAAAYTADPCDDVLAAEDNEFLGAPTNAVSERRVIRESSSRMDAGESLSLVAATFPATDPVASLHVLPSLRSSLYVFMSLLR
jgi:hypothetical protein